MVESLRAKADCCGAEVLEALVAIRGGTRRAEVLTAAASFLRVGMVLAEDIELREW